MSLKIPDGIIIFDVFLASGLLLWFAIPKFVCSEEQLLAWLVLLLRTLCHVQTIFENDVHAAHGS